MKRKDLFIVDFSEVTLVDGFNVRYDYGDIDSLAESIKENGVKMPIRAYRENKKYQIVDGHRRFKAIELLESKGIKVQIPLITEEKNTSEDQRVVDLLLTNGGKRLNPLEEAEVINRLVGFGYNDTKIAKKTSFSNTYVANLKLLHSANPDLKTMIKEGKISSTFAIKLMREHDRREEIVEQIRATIEDSERQTEQDNIQAKEKGNEKNSAKPEPKQATVTAKTFFGSTNSFSELKKAFSVAEREMLPVKPEKAILHEFVEQILSNRLKMEKIVELIFETPQHHED